jgi:chromosome partitioning protein
MTRLRHDVEAQEREDVMRVLVMAARKGGAGKTTLAASLAVAAVQAGETVALVDMDDQGSLGDWYARRQDQTAEAVLEYDRDGTGSLRDRLARIRSSGRASLVLVDTPGRFDETVRDALRQADLCLLPSRPSILDVQGTERTADELKALGRRFAFVVNSVDSRSLPRAVDAAEALAQLGPIYPEWIAQRADHLDAITLGLGVSEWKPRSPAADEIRSLWAWVRARMGE